MLIIRQSLLKIRKGQQGEAEQVCSFEINSINHQTDNCLPYHVRASSTLTFVKYDRLFVSFITQMSVYPLSGKSHRHIAETIPQEYPILGWNIY
jgi:hypothetical protein